MNQINNLLVTTTELISTFSEINIRIKNLYHRSNTDFLELNDYLKDYHKKTRIISENAFRVIDTIAGNSEMDLIGDLEKIYKRFEECSIEIENEKLIKLDIIKKLNGKSNYFNVVLRNYRQDFTTLRYLITNFSLLSNYEDFGISWKELFDTWHNVIEAVQMELTSVLNKAGSYKTQISSVLVNFESKTERSLKYLNELSRALQANIDSVIKKSQESNTKVPLLKEKTINSSGSINNIVTHLQYHDLISQKIEHIQKTHFSIIDDLKKSEKRNETGLQNNTDNYFRIGDISDLQAAQLLLVSKEYQNAIDVILKNFQGIAHDISVISDISNEFSYSDNTSDTTLLAQIKNQLDEGIILLDLNDFREINTEYFIAGKMIDEISVQLTQAVHIPIKNLSNFDNLTINSKHDPDQRPGVVKQILSLTDDMEVKHRILCYMLNETKELSENFFSFNEMESLGSQLEEDRINLMVVISRILNALDKDSDDLDNVLNENFVLNKDIAEKIEKIISKVDYYNYFEEIVEKVIGKLNEINIKVKPQFCQNTLENKAVNLGEVRSSYTMESERIIHDKVVFGTDDSVTQILQKAAEEEIEFF